MQLKPIKSDADHEFALRRSSGFGALRKAQGTATAWRF